MSSTTIQMSAPQAGFENTNVILGIHRGAIDQTTITTQPPLRVIKKLEGILRSVGVRVEEESTFRYRCIRPGRKLGDDDVDDPKSASTTTTTDTMDGRESTAGAKEGDKDVDLNEQVASPSSTNNQEREHKCTLYGPAPDDPAGQVIFSIEITHLAGLNGTYSVDIRRLKGNLKSYKFIYDAIRDRAELNR